MSLALQSPNGMTVNCHSPEPVVKAVLGRASGDRGTCQYPLLRSSEENQEPLIPSRASLTQGRGYESLTVISFTGLKSTQMERNAYSKSHNC